MRAMVLPSVPFPPVLRRKSTSTSPPSPRVSGRRAAHEVSFAICLQESARQVVWPPSWRGNSLSRIWESRAAGTGHRAREIPERVRGNSETYNSPPSRQKHRPDQPELQRQRPKRRRCVKPVWPVLHVPADPCRQRTVLVIFVERREIPPLRVAAHDLRHARFKINPAPR